MAVIVVTCRCEGGLYSPDKDAAAPIRIYSDRRIQDDIYTRLRGKKWRERLSRKDFRQVKKAALSNRRGGVV